MRYRPLLIVIAMLVTPLVFVACSDDDPVTPDNDAPAATLTSPNGGEVITPGSTVSISWSATDDVEVTKVTLSYTDDAQNGVYTEIATDLSAAGSHDWTAPAGRLYGVKVRAVAEDADGLTGTDESDGIFGVFQASERGYVTSAVCKDCHPMKYDDLFMSGHPYKLNKVVNGQAPDYPFTSVPNPPSGFDWSDITYVIGGYGWKARFMDENGYILVTGVTGGHVQYNLTQSDVGLDSPSWSDYHAGDLVPKPYTCGTCHTTGWLTTAENGGVHQDGLVGISGTWEEPGITCEACHTPGATHAATKDASNINIDQRSELCGSCHFRDTNHGILASGGYIRHHEQYDEMISAGHAFQKCTTCHDPHIGVQHGNVDRGGIKVDCTSGGCHAGTTVNHEGTKDCVECHMPRITKSSRAAGRYTGDLRTHIFNIDPTKTAKEDMFYIDDGGTTFTHGFLSLDVACYQCHTDDGGEGGEAGFASPKTIQELVDKADTIHP